MNSKIEKYIDEHSSPEDPLLAELYRETHIRFVNPNMVTGHIQGKFLELISRMINPDMILEVGTFTGYSAICLAKGLSPDGKLYTIEINDELKEFSNSYFKKAFLEEKIVRLTGDAREIIPGLNVMFDLAYIDGDKREYSEYYNLIIDRMLPGGYILADNVLWGDKVVDMETRDPQTRGIIEFNEMIRKQKNIEKIILPIRDGLMIIKII